MPYDPEEEAQWAIRIRLTDLEDAMAEVQAGPYVCELCTTPYNSRSERDHCDCDDET